MHASVDALFAQPDLPQLLAELTARWEAEQASRHAFWDAVRDDQKAEFIQGQAIYHSPARAGHIDVLRVLIESLGPFLRKNQLGKLYFEKAMVRLTRNDYEPDLVYYRKEVADKITANQYIFPIPDLVVEVLSPSTAANDRGIKFTDYALHGIPEYWIIDPEARTLEQYQLAGGEYVLQPAPPERIVRTPLIPGWELQVNQLFGS